jgi:hypothetical protein
LTEPEQALIGASILKREQTIEEARHREQEELTAAPQKTSHAKKRRNRSALNESAVKQRRKWRNLNAPAPMRKPKPKLWRKLPLLNSTSKIDSYA